MKTPLAALLVILLPYLSNSAGAAEIDHVIIAVPALDAAAVALTRATGTRTAFGGTHVSGGTANRLAALGPKLYLELLGPAPGAPPVGYGAELARLEAPKPDGFAIRVKDAEAAAVGLRRAGFKVSKVDAGGRTTPEGQVLRWKTFEVIEPEFCGFIPFFVEWEAGAPHPSTVAPGGATLRGLRAFHQRAVELTRLYAALGVPLRATLGPARLKIIIRGPGGTAVYSGVPSCPT